MRYFVIFSAIIISIILYSCERDITVKSPAYTSKPSIQCMLEPDSIPILYFSRTVPYFSDILNFANLVIRNAQITIESNTDIDNLKLDSTSTLFIVNLNIIIKEARQ